MHKFLVLFSFVPMLLISFFSLGAMRLQQNNKSLQTEEKVRTKRSVETGMNETDFINTMFLRSTFFENWSDINYFINLTLKTSKSLTYNDKWYLDFLKDSYSTGISYDKPNDKFMDLYKNWDIYIKQYNIDKFYDVDKKQFLRELTNFIYSFINKYNLTQMLNKLKTNINDLQTVNLIENNWKLIRKISNEDAAINKGKYYFAIWKSEDENFWRVMKLIFGIPNEPFKRPKIKPIYKSFYRWDRNNKPIIPSIVLNTGKILDWNIYNQDKIKDFLNNYLDNIIQENIRVHKGVILIMIVPLLEHKE